MTDNLTQEAVANYYRQLESRLGYRLLLGGEKHLGWHENGIPTKDSIARKKSVDVVASKLKLGKRSVAILLDAGCGLGGVSRYITKHYRARVEGISIVPFEIRSAKRQAYVHSSACNYRLMSYDDLDYQADYFDGIYTVETLSHAKSIQKVFQEFFRTLKPGGRIALYEYTMAPNSKFSADDRRISDFAIATGSLSGMANLRHGEFEARLGRAGFENIKVENHTQEVLPSLRRLHHVARVPVTILAKLRVNNHFRNMLVANEWYKLFEKDLWRLVIVTATKPQAKSNKASVR